MFGGTFLDFFIRHKQIKHMRTSNATFFFLPAFVLLVFMAISIESGRKDSFQEETPENAQELLRTVDRGKKEIGQHSGIKIYGWPEASVSLKFGGNTSGNNWEFRLRSDI